MISFWNVLLGLLLVDLCFFVELVCVLGGEGFFVVLLEIFGYWVVVCYFNVLCIGVLCFELFLVGICYCDV